MAARLTLRDNKQLREARPPLSMIAPMTHWTSMGFAWLNVIIGHALWTANPNTNPIFNAWLTPHVWAIIFWSLSAWMFIGLRTNRWPTIKWALIAGLLAKAFVMYGLIVLGLRDGFNLVEGVMGLWVFLVWVQIGAVLFFLPPNPGAVKDGRQ